MLLSAFVLLTGCTLAFAGGYADSKGCCEYKHVPGWSFFHKITLGISHCHSQRIHPLPLPICISTRCRIDAKIWELLPAGTPRWHDTRLLQVSIFPLLSFKGYEFCAQGWLCVQKGELWAEQGVLLQAELDLLSGVPRQGRRWRAGSRATR